MPQAYEWVALRVVPRVERGEFVNAGVVLHCGGADFLGVRVHVDALRLRGLDPLVDVEAVARHLDALRELCAGSPAAGPGGQRPRAERFRWLVAPRSTVVQPSPVHTGMTADPAAELDRLCTAMVTTA